LLSSFLIAAAVVTATGDDESPVDFDSQIVPIFTKAGCNVAACHGAAAGRGGFHLSLWGLNPEADYEAIVRRYKGRRVNLANAEESLLLLKGGGQMEHGGEDALSRAAGGEQRILTWIRRGVKRDSPRRLQRLLVTPSGTTRVAVGQTVDLNATAVFEDGTKERVAKWAVFAADDPTSVAIDAEQMTARVKRGGRHVVLARFMNQVVPVILLAPLTEITPTYAEDQRQNRIDDYVLATLKELGLPASPPADDRALARRVFLDLTGRLPSPEQLNQFVDNQSPTKKEDLITQLLNSEAFVELWTFRLATLLRIRTQPQDNVGAATFHQWLREQVKQATPYNEIARRLLTAQGDTHKNGPANFYRVVVGARNQAEYVSELLMGARMRCANCHDHPLDRWTQDDYHGLAALFAKVEQGRFVRLGQRGAVSHPRTGQVARPRIPGEDFIDEVADPRKLLAAWVTDADNPYFAKAMVNRLWRMLMGRGLIEPTDDVRLTNPPSHPELLDYLADDFIDHGYDLRHTLRFIASSAAYARSAVTTEQNQSDQMFYSHALVRPLESEVLADALADVTGVWERYGEHPSGTRAVSLFDPQLPSQSLDVLGRCSREQSCESQPSAMTLTQSLHLINGQLVNQRLEADEGRLRRLVKAGMSNDAIVQDFYLRALSRPPTDEELAYWRQQLPSSPTERNEALQDFLWSLLVCAEFVTNH
jgi:hypothetical protein